MTRLFTRRTLLGVSAAGIAVAFAPRSRADEHAAKPTAPTTPRPTVEVFARPPQINNISLSPDGKSVALITQDGDDRSLVFFDIQAKTPHRIGLGPAKVRDLFFGDNDNVVLLDSKTTDLPGFVGGKHEFRLARGINLKTAQVRTFFSHEDNFYGIVEGAVQRVKINGQYRVTAANYRMPEGIMCVYSFGFDSNHGKMLVEADAETEDFVITPDGVLIAYSDFDQDRKLWTLYFNVDFAKGKQNFKIIYKTKGEILYHPDLIGLGRDGVSVVIRLYTGDEATADYHEIAADGTLSPPLDPGHTGAQRVALFHPTTGRLAGFSRHDDWITLDYFDPLMKKLNAAVPQVMGEGYRSSMVTFAEDPRKTIVYNEGQGDAGSYYHIDFSTGAVTNIASDYPDLPEEWITQKQAIKYKAADGLDIHGYLTLPPFGPDSNLPLVVLPHGGPQARDYIDFDWQSQVLAAQGYAVLQPNFRGSTGYGDDFVAAGYGEWGGKMQTDLSDGVRYLAKRGTIDPKRVAIMGASYGGYAALAGATLDPGIYRCAISIAGPSDLKGMIDFENYNSTSSNSPLVQSAKQMMGDQKRYTDISPARQADKAYCPILLIHGTDDTVVPIEQSKRMEAALKKAGKDVQFITYKGQDHWETIPTARVTMMQAAVDFLAKYNPA